MGPPSLRVATHLGKAYTCSYDDRMIEPAVIAATQLAAARTLPVGELLGEVLPAIQRGSTLACTGQAAVSLALAVAAGASQAGSWVAIAGQPTLGLGAADAAGVALARLVAVPGDGFGERQWAETLAAMIDGFEVVLIGASAGNIRPATARRIQARAQARGAVLVTIGHHPMLGADVHLDSSAPRWVGLGAGFGVALTRQVDVEVRGRRVPRPRLTRLHCPPARLPYATTDDHETGTVTAEEVVVALDRSA